MHRQEGYSSLLVTALVALFIIATGYLYFGHFLRTASPNSPTVQPSPSVQNTLSPTEPLSNSPKEETIFSIDRYLAKHDNKGNIIPSQPRGDMIMRLPKGTTVNGARVTIDGNVYSVNANGPLSGLCPWEDTGSGCAYVDEKLPSIPIFRIWSDKKGVFALNPQSISIDGYYWDKIVITKEKPNTVFSQKEIDAWKDIVGTLAVRPSQAE